MRLTGCFSVAVVAVVVVVVASCSANAAAVEPAGAMQSERKLALLNLAIANEFEDRLKDEVAKKVVDRI
jgi:hypothetical protein